MATGLVGQHQSAVFSTPINGTTNDATVVLANDNAVGTAINGHDNDATIHPQVSLLADRATAATAKRVWITSDGLRVYLDSGSVWNELDYLCKTVGGTVTGATTFSGLITANNGLTVASGKTLTLTGATVTGLAQASVGGLTTADGPTFDHLHITNNIACSSLDASATGSAALTVNVTAGYAAVSDGYMTINCGGASGAYNRYAAVSFNAGTGNYWDIGMLGSTAWAVRDMGAAKTAISIAVTSCNVTLTGSLTTNGGLQTFGSNDSAGTGYRLVRVPNA